MIAFTLAVFFLIITPGPGVLSLAGVGAAFGPRHGTQYLVGLFVGNNVVAITVASGLAAVIFGYPPVRVLFYAVSLCYLAYLAARIAFAGSRVAFIERAAPPGVKGGILLQVVNPKAYAVTTALFSGFAFMPFQPVIELALKLLLFNAVWVPLHALWLWLGITLQRLDLSPARQRTINIAMAASMIAVVVIAAMAPR
ncbi:MAG: LysE family transporter [Pseudomonadota bacterium]